MRAGFIFSCLAAAAIVWVVPAAHANSVAAVTTANTVIAALPEPSTWMTLLAGCAAIGLALLRRLAAHQQSA